MKPVNVFWFFAMWIIAPLAILFGEYSSSNTLLEGLSYIHMCLDNFLGSFLGYLLFIPVGLVAHYLVPAEIGIFNAFFELFFGMVLGKGGIIFVYLFLCITTYPPVFDSESASD